MNYFLYFLLGSGQDVQRGPRVPAAPLGAHLQRERAGLCRGRGFSLAPCPRPCRAPLRSGSLGCWAVFSVSAGSSSGPGSSPGQRRAVPRPGRAEPAAAPAVPSRWGNRALPPARDTAPRASRGTAGPQPRRSGRLTGSLQPFGADPSRICPPASAREVGEHRAPGVGRRRWGEGGKYVWGFFTLYSGMAL